MLAIPYMTPWVLHSPLHYLAICNSRLRESDLIFEVLDLFYQWNSGSCWVDIHITFICAYHRTKWGIIWKCPMAVRFMLTFLIGSLVSSSSAWYCIVCSSQYFSNDCDVSTSMTNFPMTDCISTGQCLLNLPSRWFWIWWTVCQFWRRELPPIVVPPLLRSPQDRFIEDILECHHQCLGNIWY